MLATSQDLAYPTSVRDGKSGRRKGLQVFGRNVYLSIGHRSKFRDFQRTYRNDRIAFVYDCLPQLRESFAPYQEEILGYFDIGKRRVAVRGPHGLGKTILAAILTHHMLLTTEEDSKVATLASVWRQLEKYLWPEIHKVAKLLDWYVVGRDPYTAKELMIHNIRTNDSLSEAFAVTSGDAALIEGAHASRIMYVFDESKSISDVMWDAVEGAFATENAVILGSSTGSGECYWFAISTPGTPSGRFWQIHSHQGGYDDWTVRHVTIDEAIKAGRIGVDWVDGRAKQWGRESTTYKNRVLGEFAATDTTNLIPLEWVEAAKLRWENWDKAGRPDDNEPTIIGVDAARYGNDKTVFATRRGNRNEDLHIYGKQSIVISAGYLKNISASAQVRIEMDSGLGAGIYDILDADNDINMDLIDLYMGAGTSLMDDMGMFRFNSTRSAAWWNMRSILDPDNGHDVMLYPSDILTGDLVAPQYTIKYIKGMLTICVEDKESLRKRIKRSTDQGDAVVISFFDEGTNSGGKGVVI